MAIMTTWESRLQVSATGTPAAVFSSRGAASGCSGRQVPTGTRRKLLLAWRQARALSSNSSWRRANAWYSFCHAEGSRTLLTCTAVTLYSGQLVAQSELSVVITLAPLDGK